MFKRKPRHPRGAGLTTHAESLLRARLRHFTCSEPWVDEQIVTRTIAAPGGQTLAVRLHDPAAFPPGGRKNTAMRWCRTCGRYTPAPAIHLIEHRQHRNGPVISATLECDDCRIADDFERYRELYEAPLHLRPASSRSFIPMAELRARLKDKT